MAATAATTAATTTVATTTTAATTAISGLSARNPRQGVWNQYGRR
jgi:hypothetical protein